MARSLEGAWERTLTAEDSLPHMSSVLSNHDLSLHPSLSLAMLKIVDIFPDSLGIYLLSFYSDGYNDINTPRI